MKINPSFHMPFDQVSGKSGAVVVATIAALVMFGFVIAVITTHGAPSVDGSVLVYIALFVFTIFRINQKFAIQQNKLLQSIKSAEASNWRETVTEAYFWRTCTLCVVCGSFGAVLGAMSLTFGGHSDSLAAMLLPIAYLIFSFPTQTRYVNWVERILREATSGDAS